MNSYFVPVFVSNEAYTKGGVPAGDAAALQAIIKESVAKNLGYGTVHVYLLSPDGHVVSSIGVVRALQNDNLKKFLQTAVADAKLKPGAPVIKPHAQSHPPKAPQDSLVLHITAKGFNEGDWRQYPAENWVVLTPDESRKLLPPANAKPGTTWEVDKAVAHKILTTFYPQTEDTDTSDRNQFGEYWIKGKVLSVNGSIVQSRLDSMLQMGRSFYPGRKEVQPINAEIVGYLNSSPDGKRVDSVELTTVKATFGAEEFGVALRSGYEAPAP